MNVLQMASEESCTDLFFAVLYASPEQGLEGLHNTYSPAFDSAHSYCLLPVTSLLHELLSPFDSVCQGRPL